ncbi:uncharacterized protein [Paramisgurnus dabryanus]|uniref:uncharacterized protein n=1 Tax=Paramisgurnus dabryanus TaxID=90735 RepID=UPI0031F42E7D
MTNRFTLLIFILSLIHQNVFSDFNVSFPLDHTLYENGSISVTCVHDIHKGLKWEAKLKTNKGEIVCEIKKIQYPNNTCDWDHTDNKFKFTLKKPEARYKDLLFFCEISQVKPFPVLTRKGPEIKLFSGSNIPFPPPSRVCSCPTQTPGLENCPPTDETSHENIYTLVIIGMIVIVVVLFLYGAVITGLYIRLKATKVESSDTLTYVPMQRKVRQHDPDNTEYVDMREVQKKERSIRDVNHNC